MRGTMTLREPFAGSYRDGDVDFLLKVIAFESTPLPEKERLLRTGAKHYSEMLGPEHEPTTPYLVAFEAASAANRRRFATNILSLSKYIEGRHIGPIWLVSLARAGTPVGVLLKRALKVYLARDVRHVSLSIVVDRGIDTAALDYLRNELGARDDEVVFVDGWTGKGTIAAELQRAIARYNVDRSAELDPQLHVVADLCGATAAAATTDDYVIPSSLLGATVSGLISRTILAKSSSEPGSFHACRYYAELNGVDRSLSFVDSVEAEFASVLREGVPPLPQRERRGEEADLAATALEAWRTRLRLSSARFLKPGIGEATRVLLRRLPRQLVVRDAEDPDVRATLLLAAERGTPVMIDPMLPWKALAAIVEVEP